jgi:DNA-binding NarL/FixJ family response regulator
VQIIDARSIIFPGMYSQYSAFKIGLLGGGESSKLTTWVLEVAKTARIVVVDDHELMRRGVRSLITENSLGEVCGEAENGEQAVALVQELKPDLVMLDVSMPVMNGLEAARHIRRLAPSIKILILTMHDSTQIAAAAKEAGADALLVKSEAATKLVGTVKNLVP